MIRVLSRLGAVETLAYNSRLNQQVDTPRLAQAFSYRHSEDRDYLR